jgi:hypothetical protein
LGHPDVAFRATAARVLREPVALAENLMRRTPERARQPRLDIGRNPENGVDRLLRLPSQFNRAPSPGMAGICAFLPYQSPNGKNA